MQDAKTIGFVFVEGFADWEFGMLPAWAVEWFGARAVWLAPGARAVRSIAGFLLTPERGIAVSKNADLDALAVVGSDLWPTSAAPDLTPLLQAIAGRGGTLPLARAGLFAGISHEDYEDVPHAVADGRVVSPPGSAPGTFAHAFLLVLYPERQAELAEMRRLHAREYAPAS